MDVSYESYEIPFSASLWKFTFFIPFFFLIYNSWNVAASITFLLDQHDGQWASWFSSQTRNEICNLNILLAIFLYLLRTVIFQAGGLLGGAVASWLLGPAWELQSVARDGRRMFEDRAPIFNLTRRHPKWLEKSFTILEGGAIFSFRCELHT